MWDRTARIATEPRPYQEKAYQWRLTADEEAFLLPRVIAEGVSVVGKPTVWLISLCRMADVIAMFIGEKGIYLAPIDFRVLVSWI